MNKKEILNQLEKIKSLMLCDIFYVDEICVNACLECNYDDEGCEECNYTGIEEEYQNNEFNNDDMFTGVCKAIELLKNKGL